MHHFQFVLHISFCYLALNSGISSALK
jgi:hypothetical protein